MNLRILMSRPSHLFEGTSSEITVYLGPWSVVDSDPRRVVWQCSYAGEILEQYRAYGMFSQVPTYGPRHTKCN